MPLVRITQQDVRTPEESRQLADIVQDVMLELFAAPPGDRYQILETLPVGSIIAEDTGLGLERSDGVVIIHITQQGRGEEQKRAIYAALSERLAAAGLVREDDLIVSVVENGHEGWSFGRGRAQFLTGEL
ncbi:tautomerase family protein [Brachybacterium paraconglomeratum]|uniref:tautomerase family protein n=1 Tax=Brachybacterium paraconglomeratum TaxID=173362 RepID=UPI0022B040EE|nr:tautomerase family protein [Brachybacterium paraconglomeratum]MCZ4327841.1 tautomerase family protein [Brachybacterium paraconglomeratum]